MSTIKEPNPNCLIYDPKVLLQQFKEHIYRLDNKNTPAKMSNQYKKIYSELVMSNKNKRTKLQGKVQNTTSSNQFFIKSISSSFSQKRLQINCTNSYINKTTKQTHKPLFKRVGNIQTQLSKVSKQQKQNTQHKSNFIDALISMAQKSQRKQREQQNQVTIQNAISSFIVPATFRSKSAQIRRYVGSIFPQLNKKIIMENMFKDKLEQQISNLKRSYNQLKKELQQTKKSLGFQDKKQNKYKQVSYLSTSVQAQTQHIMIKNTKDYKQMIKKQQQTLNNLKKYRNILRKENQQLQTKYIQGNKTRLKQRPITYNVSKISHEKKYPENIEFNGQSLYSSHQTIFNRLGNNNFLNKNQMKFMQNVQKVIDILQVEQEDYEDVKATQCTKMRNIKIIDTQVLDSDRAKKITNVYRFENRYEMKLESSAQIIITMFNRLKQSVDTKEKLIIQLNNFKESFQKEQKQLDQKQKFQFSNPLLIRQKQSQKKLLTQLKSINNNSKILIKMINLFYLVLMKFRYTYKLSMTLNIQKKSFTEFLYQIDKAFNDGLYFQSYQSQFVKSLTAMHPIHHDHLNINQFIEIVQQYFPNVSFQKIKQMALILFNDLRHALILRKSWICYELGQNIGQDEQALQKFVQSLSSQCQQIYIEKLKLLSNLYINCSKSILLNKYQQKIIQNNGGGFDMEIFTMTKRYKSKSNISSTSDEGDLPKALLNQNDSQADNENCFPANDPRKITLKLGKMRNDSDKKFKILNFNVEGNSYAKKVQKSDQRRLKTINVPIKQVNNTNKYDM